MLDDRQSSIVRPKAVPPMFTPVLTQNSQSSTIMHSTTPNRLSQQALAEIGTMLRKHDREATRLYDCIAQVKMFSYNSVELRWENSPNIDGNLCVYERQQLINNKLCPSYAFAVLHGDKSIIQPITSDMVQQADKLRLFYEVARNDRREVFCLHFITESDCLRLNTFLTRCIQALKTLEEQQARTIASSVPVESQTPLNGQMPSAIPVQPTATNVYRQQMPQQQVLLPNQPTPQFGSSRVNISQTPTRLNASSHIPLQQPQQQQQQPPPPPQQQPQMSAYPSQIPMDLMHANLTRAAPIVPPTLMSQIEMPKPLDSTPFPPSPVPIANGNTTISNNNNNNNTEDPTLSLKRLLNIRGQNAVENLSLDENQVFPKTQAQPNMLDLMPPSAFEPIAATPPSPVVAIGAERVKHRLSTHLPAAMSREHFRNVLLHLVQNDDHFLDIIYQACLNHPASTQ